MPTPKLLPKKKRLQFEYDSFWFNVEYLEQIERIKEFIKTIMPKSSRIFFLAALSTIIKSCSFLDESQIKVKRDPKKVLHGTTSPIKLLKERIPKLTDRFNAFRNLVDPNTEIKIFQKPTHEIYPNTLKKETIDLIVTSPPYINAMNYPMTHRYENMFLGRINDLNRIKHEGGYYGTERVYAKDYSRLHQLNDSLYISQYLNPKLKKIFKEEPKRSFIVYKYVIDMHKAFENVLNTLKQEGRFVLVAGTNVIRGVHIDTFKILISILQDLGLKYYSSFNYEIIKNTFKLRRHSTANLIKMDGVGILEKTK